MSLMSVVASLHKVRQEEVDLVASQMDGVLGDLGGIILRGQDVLIGTFIRPGTKMFKQPDGSYQQFVLGTGEDAVEDVYQGKIARVLKLAPHAFNTKMFPGLAEEWGGEENIPKVGDWVFVDAGDGKLISYKGAGSVKAEMFHNMAKMPSDGGWPCRIVAFNDIIGKVTDPCVLV